MLIKLLKVIFALIYAILVVVTLVVNLVIPMSLGNSSSSVGFSDWIWLVAINAAAILVALIYNGLDRMNSGHLYAGHTLSVKAFSFDEASKSLKSGDLVLSEAGVSFEPLQLSLAWEDAIIVRVRNRWGLPGLLLINEVKLFFGVPKSDELDADQVIAWQSAMSSGGISSSSFGLGLLLLILPFGNKKFRSDLKSLVRKNNRVIEADVHRWLRQHKIRSYNRLIDPAATKLILIPTGMLCFGVIWAGIFLIF